MYLRKNREMTMKKVSPKKRTMGTMNRGLAVTDCAAGFIVGLDRVL